MGSRNKPKPPAASSANSSSANSSSANSSSANSSSANTRSASNSSNDDGSANNEEWVVSKLAAGLTSCVAGLQHLCQLGCSGFSDLDDAGLHGMLHTSLCSVADLAAPSLTSLYIAHLPRITAAGLARVLKVARAVQIASPCDLKAIARRAEAIAQQVQAENEMLMTE
ncbi:hypothetical protein HaLaN_21679, partial [Haematococcus lacustris]